MAQLIPEGETPVGNAETPVPHATQRRVAIVAEDDRELRVLLCTVLSYDGFAVREVSDGRELVGLVAAMHSAGEQPDLIVTDVDMPHQDGLAAIATMGGIKLGVPVVVVTSFASDEARLQAARLGAAAVLSKPFRLDQLRALADELTRCDAKPGARH